MQGNVVCVFDVIQNGCSFCCRQLLGGLCVCFCSHVFMSLLFYVLPVAHPRGVTIMKFQTGGEDLPKGIC